MKTTSLTVQEQIRTLEFERDYFKAQLREKSEESLARAQEIEKLRLERGVLKQDNAELEGALQLSREATQSAVGESNLLREQLEEAKSKFQRQVDAGPLVHRSGSEVVSLTWNGERYFPADAHVTEADFEAIRKINRETEKARDADKALRAELDLEPRAVESLARRCFYCRAPIAESMGAVLPRDALPLLLGTLHGLPRELCGRSPCHERWGEQVRLEQQANDAGEALTAERDAYKSRVDLAEQAAIDLRRELESAGSRITELVNGIDDKADALDVPWSLCPEHGPGVGLDEDGCCHGCGAFAQLLPEVRDRLAKDRAQSLVQARAEEREACAVIVEQTDIETYAGCDLAHSTLDSAAKAIRARSSETPASVEPVRPGDLLKAITRPLPVDDLPDPDSMAESHPTEADKEKP